VLKEKAAYPKILCVEKIFFKIQEKYRWLLPIIPGKRQR
jgi:hypothetical protein